MFMSFIFIEITQDPFAAINIVIMQVLEKIDNNTCGLLIDFTRSLLFNVGM